jgi:murein DD-endopeptidase MepM/ murein hydrolase activator NlpD
VGAPEDSPLAVLAARAEAGARSLLPEAVVGTEDSVPDASLTGGAVLAGAPGFVSPGPVAEADRSLLPWDEPERYTVQEGDTLNGIALEFGIEVETLLYANPDIRANPHSLAIGDEITILPVDGVLHVVEEGDTLESVAEEYGTTVAEVLAYTPNGLATGDALVAGTELVVPGGAMELAIPSYLELAGRQGSGSSAGRSVAGPSLPPQIGTGSFHIATYGRITQGWRRWHPAVDIANRTGTPIYAIDSGTVEVAGWWAWGGQTVIINHGNGYRSLYAHMSSINVRAGQGVQRGQILGGIGCTYGPGGRCSGPHLHLEVYANGGAVYPCNLGVCP